MRSFRLDPDSVAAARENWPSWVAAVVVTLFVAKLGVTPSLGRFLLSFFVVAIVWTLVSGQMVVRLRKRYPGARRVGLLAAGLCSVMVGVFGRKVSSGLQGLAFDRVWIGVTISTLLGFVVVNRRDKSLWN